MRIGLVVPGGVDRSGVDRVIPVLLALVERLARRHDLRVFVLDHEPAPAVYPLLGATVHDLGRSTAWPGLRRRDQRRRLEAAVRATGGVDVLHGIFGLAGTAAVGVGSSLGVPAVVSAESGEFVSIPDINYGLQRRWRDRRAIASAMQGAAVVTVSSDYQRRLAAACGVTARIVPLGVPSVAPAPRPPEGPPWRLLNVASLNRVKDHGTLLTALAALVAEGVDARLEIIGGDTLGGATARHAAALGVADRVTFQGWWPADRVAARWSTAHLHVVSSRHEAGSVVTLEAAMHGVPTVGTAVGHLADGAPHRAVAVPPGDAPALAAAIRALVDDPARREAVAGQAGTWTRHHDADATAEAFDTIYSAIVRANE